MNKKSLPLSAYISYMEAQLRPNRQTSRLVRLVAPSPDIDAVDQLSTVLPRLASLDMQPELVFFDTDKPSTLAPLSQKIDQCFGSSTASQSVFHFKAKRGARFRSFLEIGGETALIDCGGRLGTFALTPPMVRPEASRQLMFASVKYFARPAIVLV